MTTNPVEFDEISHAAKTLGLYWLLLHESAPPQRKDT